MTRIAHLLTLLRAAAVPALGWFAADWSGGTTLAVYWFETLASCLLISARVLLHQHMSPRYGHFNHGASTTDRGAHFSSFVSGFTVTSLAFCAVHAVFLAAIVLVLTQHGKGALADINWHSIGFGCLSVLAFLIVDFLVDLISLRKWSFWDIEQLANRGLSRVIVVHLTIIVGFIGIAATGAPDALFGVFVVLKTLAALSWAVPQWEPAAPPKWLSSLMNRIPNVRPGERFEDSWANDRTAEATRRERNERPWLGRG